MEEYKTDTGDQNVQLTIVKLPQPPLDDDCTENINEESEMSTADNKSPLQNDKNLSTVLPKREWLKKGASRMAGFMFYTNAIGVVLLFIGFVTPGWLTINSDQDRYYDSWETDRYASKSVYQDYSLWYMTQCDETDGTTTCQTITYRTIDTLHEKACDGYSCSKIRIGSMEITDPSSLIFFSGAALVFNYTEIVRTQAMYTIGLCLALYTLSVWYKFCKGVSEDRITGLSKMKWNFLCLVLAISATFVFVPVFMYMEVTGRIREVESPVGLVFAGFGWGMIVICNGTVLLHLLCCRSGEAYLCSSENDRGFQVPQDEEDV